MDECLFCGIVGGRVKGEVVFRSPSVVAFKDVNPQAPVHILIVPRKHMATLLDLGPEDRDLLGDIFAAARKLAADSGIAHDGFRVVANCGPRAGQSVYHIHFHLLGGRSMAWPPG